MTGTQTAAAAKRAIEISPRPPDHIERGWVVCEDDLESGAVGWAHGDDSYIPVKFHIDTYLAYDDPGYETDHSWWCGELNPEFTGGDGYGNHWDQRLELPPIDLGTTAVERTSWSAIKGMYREGGPSPRREDSTRPSASPVLSFRYRHDTEAGYDFAYVEVLDGDEWVTLNGAGYDGSSGGWQEAPGFSLDGYGDPVRVRFRFVSDAAWSDGDGYYDTDGGAFHVDNICVHDAVTGATYFTEDCDGDAAQCRPGVPEPAGDYWHLVDSACQAYSGTRSWSCSYPDSAHVPPNLRNWLMTPVVDIGQGPADACTLYFTHQMFMSGTWGGSWQEWGTADGGQTWLRTGWWYGDQCEYGYGTCDHSLGEIPIMWPGWQGHQVAGKWVMLTDHEGNGPSPYCPRAGLSIDDTWVEVWYY